MEIDKITELAGSVLKNSDISQKRNGLVNLVKMIRDDIPAVLSACTDLINDENSWLRYGYYKSKIATMIGPCNIHKRVINLVEYNMTDIKGYERDTEEKRAERTQKLCQYQGVVSIELQDERKSPNLIYCMDGSYRKYSELCHSFEYRLCRAIQEICVGGLKSLYQEVCLYIALMNELRVVEAEMGLLGMVVQEERKTDERERGNNAIELNINEEELRPYFKSEFCGVGYKDDNFAWLVDDLKASIRTRRDAATWALCIYQGDKMNGRKRPHTFRKWYKEFCRLIGVQCGTFKPSQLDIGSIREKHNYL